MGTAYAIVCIEQDAAGQPSTKVWQILWREQEAIEMVERLNALGRSEYEPYSWRETWVARVPPDHRSGLTPEDREKLERARGLGALDTERPLAVLFSFPFNRQGALAAYAELAAMGWPDAGLDEEIDGDDLWHVWGHYRRMLLTGEAIERLRAEMEDLAERLGGTFDGWDVSDGHGLRWATEPDDLPS